MIWIDGQVSAGTILPFDLRDRGLLLADGLFETLLVVGGVPFQQDEHLERLRCGARLLRLDVDSAVVAQAIRALAQRLEGPGVVRVTVTRGVGPRGLALPREQQPRVFASAAPWSASSAFRTLRLATSAIRRNAASPLSRVKSLAYLDNVLALDEAVTAGADDALMLSTAGRVACTSAANVFVLEGDELATPPTSDGALPGTTRALLLRLADRCGLRAAERSLAPDDLRNADAVLITNSVRLLCRVTHLDGHPLPRGMAEVLRALSLAVRATIAEDCAVVLPVVSRDGAG